MPRPLRNRTTMQIIACCVAGNLGVPAVANERSLAEAFLQADIPQAEAQSKTSYKIEGCVFQRTIVNLNYCNLTGKGDGDRIINSYVDLREVESISAGEHNGKFHISFDVDFGGPGTAFVLIDRVLNGAEGAFDRFQERSAAAFEAADINSGKTYSNCDGTPPELQKSMRISVFTDTEPEGWRRLLDIASECRAPKPLKISEK